MFNIIIACILLLGFVNYNIYLYVYLNFLWLENTDVGDADAYPITELDESAMAPPTPPFLLLPEVILFLPVSKHSCNIIFLFLEVIPDRGCHILN